MPFYDNFVAQCARINKKPSVVAQELGLAKSAVSHWKARGAAPRDAMQHQIAAYFGCTVDDLTADPGQKEKPAHDDVNEPNKEALLRWIETATRDELIEALQAVTKKLSEK